MRKQMQDNYDWVISLLDTGMRYGNFAKLPWSSVDMDAGIHSPWMSRLRHWAVKAKQQKKLPETDAILSTTLRTGFDNIHEKDAEPLEDGDSVSGGQVKRLSIDCHRQYR